MTTKLGSVVTYKAKRQTINYKTLRTRGHVRSRDKLKIFYPCHNTNGHRTRPVVYTMRSFLTSHIITCLVILIVLTRFVGLERKRLSGHQRLVIFVIGDLFASCYIQRKYSERWQTSKMKLLRKIVNGFTISAKSLIFDV